MDPRGRKTAAKFWEYRHAVSNSGRSGAYKYADAVGMAERLDNANTLVLFGRDFDSGAMPAGTPRVFTFVESGCELSRAGCQ